MLPPLIESSRHSPADRWLWALLGFLVVGQLLAFWMVCRQQVDRAEVREAQLRAERIALRDECAPRNGRATCMPQPANPQPPTAGDAGTMMSALR